MKATLHSNDPVLASFAEEVGTTGQISVSGNRTRWAKGGELVSGTTIVSAPTGIVEYIPEEMIVTVRAGTTVDELHQTLKDKGQWTALPERGGTIGGAVAIGENDYRRPARGDLRSAVLQVRYVSAEGTLVTAGGPTVKNVSGFDLPRLMTGSLGTLGCLAEVILRTNPIPATTRWLEATNADPFAIHAALLQPGPILWDGTTTRVMLFGHEVAVDADQKRLAGFGTFAEVSAPPAPQGHRWSVAPATIRQVTETQTGAFVAEVGIGLIHAEHEQTRTPLDPGTKRIHDRMKAEFDPNGRLNPGRVVGAR